MAIAAEFTAFHGVGAALAVWAVLLALLGIMRENFPPKGGEKVVIAISALLVAGAIGTAVTEKPAKEPKGGRFENAKRQVGSEGSSRPRQGGTPAPGTGAGSQGAGQATPGKSAKQPQARQSVQTLRLSTDPGGALRFTKSKLSAGAGNVQIILTNAQPVPHNISIQGPGINKHGPTVTKGGVSRVSAKLKPGRYTFYCSVPGHREAGMQGTLTVTR